MEKKSTKAAKEEPTNDSGNIFEEKAGDKIFEGGMPKIQSSDGDNISPEEEALLPKRPTDEEYRQGKLAPRDPEAGEEQ